MTNENKHPMNAMEMSDDSLDQVTGGGSADTGWLDDGIPSHWPVTCAHCGLQFYVRNNSDCPSCAGKEVYLTYNSSKPIYDVSNRSR